MDIAIHQLLFTYPGSAFRLRIEAQRWPSQSKIGIIGPSGSGKTTLLRLLAGVLLPEQGRIQLGSQIVNDLKETARRRFRNETIGQVFQDFRLIDYLNVEENILLPQHLIPSRDCTSSVPAHRLPALADRLKIGSLLKRPVQQLSQGERQRVAIARALYPQPSLILADEPTGNLDPANKRLIHQLLLDEAQHAKATLILVTHDHDLLDGMDQVIDFQHYLNPTCA